MSYNLNKIYYFITYCIIISNSKLKSKDNFEKIDENKIEEY